MIDDRDEMQDAGIGIERELTMIRRILRDWLATAHDRHVLTGPIEIALRLDPSPLFRPRAVLSPDGYEVVLTYGTLWWAYLCARALTRWDNDLPWPSDLPTEITAPRHVPRDADVVRSYGELLLIDVPEEGDGFFVFLFVTILFGVIFHEVGHILRGHLRLLAAYAVPDLVAGAGKSLFMVDDGSDAPIELEDVGRRDLEHDADSVAGFLHAELLLGIGPLFPIWERSTPAENFTWGLVGYALFCGGVALEAPSCAAYPDAISRLMSYFYGGRQHIAVDLPDDPRGDQATINAFSVLASAEQHIPYVAAYRVIAEDDGLQVRLDELMEIMDHMPALNRRLKPYWMMPSREDEAADAPATTSATDTGPAADA